MTNLLLRYPDNNTVDSLSSYPTVFASKIAG